jgi:nucleotide-binding universal stress UspA family protein
MTVMQGGAIHGDEFRDVASRPVGADSVQGIMTRRPVGAVPESMMNSGAALATRPPCLDRVSRLVVVSETSDLPPWIRGWWRGAGRDLQVHCVPATVPSHRLAPVHLLSEIAELLADPVLVIQPGSDGTGLPEVIAALHDLPDDAPVLAAVADIAQHLGSPVVLIHGLPVSFAERSVGLRPAMQHGRRLLDAAARRIVADAPDVRVVTRLVRAHPHELVGEDLDTGLLVVGGPRRGGADDLGLVARSALHHATCPVLVVPR